MLPLLQKGGRPRAFFPQEKLHSRWFEKVLAICLSSAKSLGKKSHIATLFGETKSRRKQKEKSTEVELTVWQQ